MKFFTKLEKNKIQCTACARHCNIQEGCVGYCGVRKNTNNVLEILNNNRLIFLKKDKRNLLVGSLGNNMRIPFDPNWDTSLYPFFSAKDIGREKTNEKIRGVGFEYTPEKLVKYAESLKCEKIVFQFNEPLVYLEYILEVCRLKKTKVSLVTTGYFSKDSLEKTLAYVDEITFLFFSTFDKFYIKHCSAQLPVIKKNMKEVFKSKTDLRILCPLVSDDLESVCRFVKSMSPDIPICFFKFQPSNKVQDRERTSDAEIKKVVEFAKTLGLKKVSEKCILN